MPTYEYVCRACGHLFEIVQSMRDDALTECPECGGELRKVFAPPAISFKGSGFYATDQTEEGRHVSGGDKGDKGEKGDDEESSSELRLRLGGARDSGDGKKDSKSDAPPPSATKERTSSSSIERLVFGLVVRLVVQGRKRARDHGRHRGLRRLGLLLVPRRHRDGRGRDALRLAERTGHDR